MELILTEEEKAAATWLELDDAAVGRLVKYNCSLISEISDELERVRNMSAAMILITGASQVNASGMTQTLEGCSEGDTDLGDWRIAIERIEPPRPD